MNIQCLISQKQKTKVTYLKEMSEANNAAIIGLSETWLHPGVKNEEVGIQDYSLLRSDRVSTTNPNFPHGGTAIYIHNSLPFSTSASFSNGVCEAIGAHIDKLSLTVVVIYRPPKSPLSTFREALTFARSFIETSNPKKIALVGDFNFSNSHVTWRADDHGAMPIITGRRDGDWSSLEALLDFSGENFLVQQISAPTRGNSVLDLAFVSDPDMIEETRVTASAISDHNLITIATTVAMNSGRQWKKAPAEESESEILALNFNKTNWPEVRKALQSMDLTSLVSEATSVENGLHVLLATVREACYQWTPRKKQQTKIHQIPAARRRLFRKRCNLLKQLLKVAHPQRRAAISKRIEVTDQQILSSIVLQRTAEESQAVEDIAGNPKRFFAYANRWRTEKSQIGPLEDPTGRLITEPAEVASTLSKEYYQAFSTPVPEKVVQDPNLFFARAPSSCELLEDLPIYEDCVKTSIKSLRSGSAPGPDGVPVVLLKECVEELSGPLAALFRRSLDTGEIPCPLKLAKIIPIHKGGSRKLAKNYRPIALTSLISRVMEKVVKKGLVTHLESGLLLDNNQHGFRGGRSTLSQLVAHMEEILKRLEHGDTVDVIYLDFAKAFDKVDHGVLQSSLREKGITGKLGVWLHRFLTGRKQFVSANGNKSATSDVVSGVPQGTVLGPVLFLVMLSSIGEEVTHTYLSSFADDTKLLHSTNTQAAVDELQEDLNNVYRWARENNMQFNGSKFQLMRYGSHVRSETAMQYTDSQGNPICEQPTTRDLGITMSSDCSFSTHITTLVQDATRMTGWVLRTFHTRERRAMLTLYKALILSRLDYCSPLWNPSGSAYLCGKIEGVQRAFSRRIEGMQYLNYWERLATLNLYSVQRRRERYLILYIFKILHNLVPNCGIIFRPNPRTGIHAIVPKIIPTSKVRSLRGCSFPVIAPTLYNTLPHYLRIGYTCDSPVETFKRHLDQLLSTIPDQPTIPGLHRASESNSLVHQMYCI
jgi:Reverse transcriptase (RNA-dependent DNA polymerase)/Endonuclease-reverse transcriptase